MTPRNAIRFRTALVLMAVSPLLFAAPLARAQLALIDEPRPANILLQTTDEGVVFADSRGMSLYYGSDPNPGVSTCTSEAKTHSASVSGDVFALPNQDRRPSCMQKQKPVEVGAAQPVGAWTVVNRPDGIKQWAYKGKPVYTSVKDFRPGDVNGGPGLARTVLMETGRTAAYAPVVLPPEVRIEKIGVSSVLATNTGRTLYTSRLDPKGKSACEDKCTNTWHPLLAADMAVPQGDWSVVLRADKTPQWAFKGKPLYTYVDDLQTADAKGVRHADWQVALAYPKPPLPSVVTIRPTAIGPRYTDPHGMTLYVWHCVERLPPGGVGVPISCDDTTDRSLWWTTPCGDDTKCADIWRPLLAGENAKAPPGNTWSVVTMPLPWSPVRAADDNQSGVKVWAYMGRPLFTYKFEDRPGMIDGEDIGVLGVMKWASISAAGEFNQTKTQTSGRQKTASR